MNIPASLKEPRTLAVVAAGLFLTWLVVSRSFATYLADTEPQVALWLDPHQPLALINLAERGLASPAPPRFSGSSATSQGQADSSKADAGTAKLKDNFDRAFSEFLTLDGTQSYNRQIAPDDEPAIRELATTALQNDPLNSRAVRVLGQLADADGQDQDALQFMTTANRLSLHEDVATYWLMINAFRARDFKTAVYYADVLMRANVHNYTFVIPILGRISGDKEGAALVEATLANNPPWRDQFVSLLPSNVTDARTPLEIFSSLKTSSVPSTAADLKPYLDFLIGHKFYDLAYYAWLQFLPADALGEVGLLYNGNFDAAPSGLPFDWVITQGSGVTIDIVPRPDKSGEHALLIDFQYGRVEYQSVTQLVMLPPGTYEFGGEYKGELNGPRGLKWRVVCVNGTLTSGGESAMIVGTTKDWRKVGFTFTVPDKDCAAQYVRLDLDARMASERLITGSVLFDRLQISRASDPSAPEDKPD